MVDFVARWLTTPIQHVGLDADRPWTSASAEVAEEVNEGIHAVFSALVEAGVNHDAERFEATRAHLAPENADERGQAVVVSLAAALWHLLEDIGLEIPVAGPARVDYLHRTLNRAFRTDGASDPEAAMAALQPPPESEADPAEDTIAAWAERLAATLEKLPWRQGQVVRARLAEALAPDPANPDPGRTAWLAWLEQADQ